ncbi:MULTISPECIES: M64 family metallopeptidase [unclassified Bradyrhizobium]|uniref:M64 family metallopeptidase n=1 Tax=unclassified Bradyrhizobium TaxID=2631580 RepID=UPI0028F137B4|nr:MULTISPECIES: M64 family metallopeptidase [unclassified Bradyrhizobium]
MPLIVYPHCDMHVALKKPATKVLPFRVFDQDLPNGSTTYTLTDVTADCNFRILAPYNPVGSRLTSVVTIDPAARTITGDDVGTNLVVIEYGPGYIVARIQVHDDVLGWWFGNSSITTALHPTVAHSQPTLCALFSDDPTGTDLVGDITGHGFVTLSSASPGTFVVANTNNEGRLRGVSEGAAQLDGSFLGVNQSLPVKVVDYAKIRDNISTVRAGDLANAAEMHNILFLAEGFRASEKDKFDKIVQEAADGLFSQKRHEPYGTLAGSFNVFKAFQASEEQAVTCGWRVNDEETSELSRGGPIPWNYSVSDDKSIYEVDELVARVGLPLRNETATPAQLKARWAGQSLPNYDAAKVNDTLIEAWRKQKSLGILEARDTFYGLMLGSRWGDRSAKSGAALTMPAADAAGDANLAPLIARAYQFFKPASVTRHLAPDPRRHPPELARNGRANVAAPIMAYLSGLRLGSSPHTALGAEWIPDGTFKRSRGLIAMITNEDMIGGTNFNQSTVTANSLQSLKTLDFEYPATNTATKKVMRRKPASDIDADLTDIIDTVAHEFGHSFNLGDEYETSAEDNATASSEYDNIVALADIFQDPSYAANHSRLVDPSKVKWFELLRVQLSAKLTQASTQQGGSIEVRIDPRQIPRWVQAKAAGRQAFLRRIQITAIGQQLPLTFTDSDYLVRLDIGDIDQNLGSIRLGGLELPPAPFPVFPKGSLLFVPRRDDADALVYVVEKKVRDFITGNHLPLNKDTDTAHVNDEADDPKDIPNFKPPCKAQRLVGLYEGANNFTGLVYRPAGDCKMRNSSGTFCHVCKWLITNRIDPALHDVVDREFYPEAKKNG